MVCNLKAKGRILNEKSTAKISILPDGGHSLINLTDTILEQINERGN